MLVFNSKIKSLAAFLCLIMAFGVFSGCAYPAQQTLNASHTEVLTQKPIQSNKTQITVLVKYAFTINSFENAVEEKFPNIDIIQVGNFTRDMGIEEYAARLEHNDITDIVMTWPLEVGEEYWADNLLDLSGMSFTSKYNLSMLNSIADDEGALYYLPGPAQIRGIVYNKTLFEENNWEVPKDFEGFLSLCKQIEGTGIKALQLGFANSEVLDTAMVGFSYGSSFSKLQDAQWLEEYNSGKGSLGDHFTPMLQVFQQMIDEGVFTEADLKVNYSDREKMFFTRQCAMVEDSVLMSRIGYQQTGTTDEFALMPFFSPASESDWARLYMVCYIGLNKNLEKPENSQKYKEVLKIMEYISSVEGQEALTADTGAMFSSLSEAEPPNVPEIDALRPSLKQGRYSIFPSFKNAQTAIQEGLAGMLKGTATIQDVISAANAQNIIPPVKQAPSILGTAERDFSLTETGTFVAEALRAKADADIGLFLDNGKDGRYNGKGISGKIYSGEVTNVDVLRIFPDLKHGETGTLWKVKMTGENLIKTLEYAISIDNNQTGWFYYFSGIKVKYNVGAKLGSRINKITLADGTDIDKSKIFTIAIMDETVPAEHIIECEKYEDTVISVVENAIINAGEIKPYEENWLP